MTYKYSLYIKRLPFSFLSFAIFRFPPRCPVNTAFVDLFGNLRQTDRETTAFPVLTFSTLGILALRSHSLSLSTSPFARLRTRTRLLLFLLPPPLPPSLPFPVMYWSDMWTLIVKRLYSRYFSFLITLRVYVPFGRGFRLRHDGYAFY